MMGFTPSAESPAASDAAGMRANLEIPRRRSRHLVEQNPLMPRVLARGGFTKFVQEQGVIGLGIAVVLGGAVGRVITSLVNDIIQPIIGFLVGSPEGLAKLHFKSLMYGNFIAALIDFIIVAGVIYIVLKKLGLDKLDKPKEK